LPPTDKIRRAIIWMRKTLDITQKTTQPGSISGEIRPTLDVFGWDRYKDIESVSFSGTNVTTASMGAIGNDVMRLIINGQVDSTNNVLALFLNFRLTSFGGQTVALQEPFLVPIGSGGLDVGMLRPVLLGPGDNFSVSSRPATGIGELLVGRIRFIDLPIGEYIPPV